MSQHHFQQNGKQVQLGYDRGLRGFFLNIRQGDEPLYTSLSEGRGTIDFRTLQTRLQEHGLPLPGKVQDELHFDEMGFTEPNNSRNFGEM